jgi:hypothetical protein
MELRNIGRLVAGNFVPAKHTPFETPVKHSVLILLFHRAFFSSIVDKTPTHAPIIQHYIIPAC